MICRRILPARDANRSVTGVIVGTIFFVFPTVISSLVLIAELLIDQRQVVVGREILGINRQGLFEFSHRFVQKFLLRLHITVLHLRPFNVRLAKFVDHLVILAEIESSPIEFGITILENTAKFGDGVVKKPVLLVYQAIEPRDRPARRRRIAFCSKLKSGHCILQAAFFEINSPQINWSRGTSQLLHLLARLLRLNEFTLLGPPISFEKETNPIIVPTLPYRNR